MSDVSESEGLSAYERMRWDELQLHWQRKAKQRELLPAPAQAAMQSAAQAAQRAASKAGRTIAHATPDIVKDAGRIVLDASLAPTVAGAVHILELLNEWVMELSDPGAVLRYHQAKGRDITSLEQLSDVDLEHLDGFAHGMVMRWRTLGAGEGAGLGVLAMIPVPVVGSVAAITLDLLAMQVLSTAIATRVCYAYGFNATDPDMRNMIDRMVGRVYRDQAAKAGVVKNAGDAFTAAKNRINWSEKLRKDHRLMAAVEKLLKKLGDGTHVPVKNARMGMPLIAVVTGAGTNAFVLGDVAKQARNYAATLFLVQKYGLDLPPNLRNGVDLAPDIEG